MELDEVIEFLKRAPQSLEVKDSLEELRMIKEISRLHPDKMQDPTMQLLIKDAIEDAVEISGLQILGESIDK